MTAARALAIVAALVVAPPQTPARDAAVTPTTGTASISGVVVTDATPAEPVRRAIVTVTGPDLHPSRGAITDDDGRFRIVALPAGRVTMTVARASFITSAYGAKRAGRPGTAIAIQNGESIENLVVTLWRGAAISGIVRDEFGTPVSGVGVTAFPARPVRGATVQTLNNNPTTTNDLGEFRIFGLEPGTYIVGATPSSGSGGAMIAMNDAEVDRALAVIRSGQRSAQPSQPVQDQQASPPFDYAAVYFPGTSTRSLATTMTLAAGEARTGVDFSLQRVATARVEGVITRPDGQMAVSADVQLTEMTTAGPFAPDVPLVFTTRTGPDGRFRFSQVTPGAYRLVARVAASPPQNPAAAGFASPFPTGPTFSGVDEITISGNDVSGLAIQLQPGLTLSGRLQFQGQSRPPANLANVRLALVPPQVAALRPGARIDSIAMPAPGTVKADGTFQFDNIVPGRYLLRIAGTDIGGAGWYPRSALLNGRDLLDAGIDISRGDNLQGVVITLTDQHTELSGTLQTPDGKPVSDVFVLAFSTDKTWWGPNARRVQAVRPGLDGRFTFADLPPGEYALAGATSVDQGDWEDPAFLEPFLPTASRITLGEGEKKVQNLRVGPVK